MLRLVLLLDSVQISLNVVKTIIILFEQDKEAKVLSILPRNIVSANNIIYLMRKTRISKRALHKAQQAKNTETVIARPSLTETANVSKLTDAVGQYFNQQHPYRSVLLIHCYKAYLLTTLRIITPTTIKG